MKRFCYAVTALLVAANAHANPLDHGDLVTFPTRDGVTQSIFIESPSPSPPWVIVLFGGTPGNLHLDASGATTLKGNFLIRPAHHWIDWGDAVVLVDTPSDHTEGVDDLFRRSKASFTDTQAVMATWRQRFPNSKIALVGTSAETVSVGNALGRDPTLADAFVLTSPVTVSHKGSATISNLEADGAKHRVLVISNEHDECVSSPAYAGKRLAEHNHFDFVSVDSTDGNGDASQKCGGHSPHGFLGVEKEVLSDINSWLAGQPVATQ
ncbi:hypothetical protein DSC91_003300 [Paraburkholderia caffeinilytica]|uniref:Alpha/beta hydrolase n=1 Tax=Paraburkholderia caffeinilytica TaxID=1761016 RepID=A0ABQ1NE53_9BURK|nr:hypothetical protein [Paraburkholderia caffeinilytica]AXL50893.1 hypothetical protein DSC91_003300 [Paraburkholderia caffeinilytica]GGC73889.1 hypothetical protein GCM10011400_72610 [Paraburkholderia caffeinilytica]CAB3809422.1 hypothetical protein LMG28690_07289 [Paraburkholderia caffeinilytica]